MSVTPITTDMKHWQTKYSYKNARRADILRLIHLLAPFVVAIAISCLFLLTCIRLSQRQNSGNWLDEIGLSVLCTLPILLSIIVPLTLLKSSKIFFENLYQPPSGTNSTLLILRRLLGISPYILIQKDKIDSPNEWIKWFGGPARLLVFDGFALYVERGNQFSRIIGPGMPIPFLDRTETVKAIVDLRPQIRKGEFTKVRAWTRDGIKIEMDVRMECKIGSLEMTAGGSEQLLYSFDPLAVKKAVERTAVRYDHEKKQLVETDWVDGVWGRAQGFMASYITRHSVDELFLAEWGSSQILSFNVSSDLLKSLNSSLKDFGAMILNLQISNINIPEDVKRQRLDTWGAEKQSITTITEGQIKAYGIRTREKARAEAQRDIIAAIAEELEKIEPTHLQESLLMTLSDILNQSLSDPWTRTYITSEALNTLEKINDLLKG